MPDGTRYGALVQARLSSRRLQGKALLPLAGRPVLAWTLDRLARARGLDEVIVTTSATAGDDPIADFCDARQVPVHRGSLEDVAGRMLEAAETHGLGAVVRISGDSPLIDPEIVSAGVELFRRGQPDLVSNVYPERSFPAGQSVEVIRTVALAAAREKMDSEDDREHVTPLFYREPQRFEIVGFAAEEAAAGDSLAVDTGADLAVLNELLAGLDGSPIELGWRELLARKRALVAGR